MSHGEGLRSTSHATQAGYVLAVPAGAVNLRPMLHRAFLPFLGLGIALSLPSCGLIKAPFRVVGAVADGTAKVGKKAAVATADAFTTSEEEKAAKEKKKQEKEAKEAAKNPDGKKAPEDGKKTAEPGSKSEPESLPDDYLPPLPGTSEPLPDDSSVPYQKR